MKPCPLWCLPSVPDQYLKTCLTSLYWLISSPPVPFGIHCGQACDWFTSLFTHGNGAPSCTSKVHIGMLLNCLITLPKRLGEHGQSSPLFIFPCSKPSFTPVWSLYHAVFAMGQSQTGPQLQRTSIPINNCSEASNFLKTSPEVCVRTTCLLIWF